MALAQVSHCFAYTPLRDVYVSNSARISSSTPLLPRLNSARIRTSFATGSPLAIRKAFSPSSSVSKGKTSIRCEQSTNGDSSLDVSVGRLAMAVFATAITVEIATGKGLLENLGLTTALPGVALGITALLGVSTAIFIFRSGSKN